MAISPNETTENPFPKSSDVSNGLHGSGAKVMDRVVQGAHQAVDRLAEKAGPAIDAVSGHADQWNAAQEEWVESARNTVREHPLAALGAAVLFGMVVSRLTR